VFRRPLAFLFVLVFLPTSQAFETKVQLLDESQNKIQISHGTKVAYQLSLSVPAGLRIEQNIQFYGDDKFGLIVYQVSDHDSTSAIIQAVSQAEKKLWSFDLGVFNPSAQLVDDKFVYIAGFDKIAKLNKHTGQVVWSKERLYDDPAIKFDGGGEIKKEGSYIRFSDKLVVSEQGHLKADKK